MTEHYHVGDTVELLVRPPVKGWPAVGSIGVVVIADEPGEMARLVSVAFGAGIDGVPYAAYQVPRRDLRRVTTAAEGPA